jgi:hypothetical protein
MKKTLTTTLSVTKSRGQLIFLSLCIAALSGCAGIPMQSGSQSVSNANYAVGLIGYDKNVEFRVVSIAAASSGWLEYVIEGRNKSGKEIRDIRGFVIDESGKQHGAALSVLDVQKTPSISSSAMLSSGIATSTMLLGVPILGPLAMLGYGASQMAGLNSDVALANGFSRSLQGASLPGKEEGKGSFFFPAVKPSKVKVGYVINGARRYVVAQ